MDERTIRRAVRAALEERGALVVSTTGALGNRGVPDFIACHRGRFIGIEVKRPGQKLQPAQELWAQRIQKARGWHFVVTSAEEAKQALDIVEFGLDVEEPKKEEKNG